jgi:hypothetical protein
LRKAEDAGQVFFTPYASSQAIPAKVRSGFASGIAYSNKQFQQKCAAVLRPELRTQTSNSSKSA